MAVQNLTWAWDWVFAGSNGYTASNQYNFAPMNALAQTSLAVPASPGLVSVGFTQYGSRPQPNGADEFFNIPSVSLPNGEGFIGYQPVIYNSTLVSVTWVMDCNSEDGQMVGTLLIFQFD